MTIEKMKIDPVKEAADSLTLSANKMKEILNNSDKNIATLEKGWNSQKSKLVTENYLLLSKKFPEFYDLIIELSKYISNAQNVYIEAHDELQTKAEELLED